MATSRTPALPYRVGLRKRLSRRRSETPAKKVAGFMREPTDASCSAPPERLYAYTVNSVAHAPKRVEFEGMTNAASELGLMDPRVRAEKRGVLKMNNTAKAWFA